MKHSNNSIFNENIFYPLYGDFDKEFFKKLKTAIVESYAFVGESEEKEFFIKCLLCLQMIKDYHAPLVAIHESLQHETHIEDINNKVRSKDFIIDYSWAVWKRDKIMGELAEKFYNSKIDLIGTTKDFNEFVLRYLISIWLTDWEGPLYAILQRTKSNKVDLKKLNNLLSLWDFTGLFD